MTDAIKLIYFTKSGTAELDLEFSKENDRDTSNLELEKHVESVWSEKLKKNSRLWNATKFRLAKVENNVLHIGITDYRAYCATDYNNPFHEKLSNKFSKILKIDIADVINY